MNDQIKAIEIELTNRCNAGCPMCTRTNNQQVLANPSTITYAGFKKILPPETIAHLNQLKFCGNLGDPALCKDVLKIHQYVVDINPQIRLIFSSNGGIRSEEFWGTLSKYYINNPESVAYFCVDGLEDTNHIYRVGVSWSKVMKNMKAFVAGGGNAEWVYIVFFHNEHQIDKARRLAGEIGILFTTKMSARFDGVNPKNGIYPATDPQYRVDDLQQRGELRCVSQLRSELYIDSFGRLFPCCWTATKGYIDNNSLYHRSIYDVYRDFQLQLGTFEPTCSDRCTGSKIHVLERRGERQLQKMFWV